LFLQCHHSGSVCWGLFGFLFG